MWLEKNSYVPNLIVVVAILLVIWWGNFYFNHQEDAIKIDEMQKEIDRLVIENSNQRDRIIILEAKNQKLKEQQTEINQQLTNYFTQEILWDTFGTKKYRMLCDIAKIVLREDIPSISKVPC